MTLTLKQLQRGREAYRENEPRDSMYRVATFLLQQPDWWGNVAHVTDALAVLLLTWNASFYRYNGGWVDAHELEECLRSNWGTIEQFHDRDILSFNTDEDGLAAKGLFECFLEALKIKTTRTGKVRRSPVAVAKALHLLAQRFFPIWDNEIAGGYGCSYSREPASAYINFCAQIRDVAAALGEVPPSGDGKSLVKCIDEYNYARFTKRWIM